MDAARLQQAIQPLEKLFRKYGFSMEGEPLAAGSTRTAYFMRPDGIRAEYEFTIIKDRKGRPIITDRGRRRYPSDTEIELSVRLYLGEDNTVELYPYGSRSTNAPLFECVKNVIDDEVSPRLKEQIQPIP